MKNQRQKVENLKKEKNSYHVNHVRHFFLQPFALSICLLTILIILLKYCIKRNNMMHYGQPYVQNRTIARCKSYRM